MKLIKNPSHLKTVKELLPSIWTIHACSPDEVYYLIKKGDTLFWKTLGGIPDARNMLVFPNKKSVIEFLKYSIRNTLYPIGVDAFDISEAIPAYSDDGYWTENISNKRVLIAGYKP